MIRALTASFIIFAISPANHASPPTSEETLSGTIELNFDAPGNRFGMRLSDHFDPDATLDRAREAERIGDFDTAFHSHWAVCESGRDESCLKAAMLADTRIIPIPEEIVVHLYERAYASGLSAACDLPRKPK